MSGMKGFFREFQTFLLRGSAVDLAFGVVIGAAFGQITTSLANNVLTPPLGLLMNGGRLASLVLPIGNGIVISYGLFLESLINFVIIVLALFLLVKIFNALARKRRREEQESGTESELTLLREIRDQLRARS